jgi:translation initiation factor eIF-2B subunit delta
VCANLLSDKIREIESDRSSGASQIARNALGVLRFFVQTSKNETSGGFVEEFREVGRRLFEARPNMAPVQNLVAQIIYEVNILEEHDLVSVRKFALSRIDELSEESETAVKKSAEEAVALIDDSDCLATCSYSSTVYETFKVAKRQGKSFKVFVAESRSDDGKFRYGQTLATFLKSIKIPAEVFADNEIHRYVPKTKCVLVGADSLLFDGSIINGRPPCEVAVTAKEHGIPVYSVCETIKANTLSYLGKNVELKKGFDLVPANLITGIVTEKGILDTKEIVEIMKEKSKFF